MFPDTAGGIQKMRMPKKLKREPDTLFSKLKTKLKEILAFLMLVLSIWLFTGVGIFLLFNFYENDINDRFIRKYSTEPKNCLIKTRKHELTGERVYSYTYIDLFGYQIRRNSSVQEKTRINIAGYAVSIVGVNTDNTLPVSLAITDGEKYSQFLEKADKYIFTLGEGRMKETVLIDYKKLCN